MGFYENRILPHLLDKACGAPPIAKQREKVVPQASGRVLEIGMGSGLNIPFYDPSHVEFVWGLEPSDGMRRKAAPRLEKAPFEIKWLDLPGEEIPLEDNSADTVLLTYTLCTIPDFSKALAGMRRVLKPSGRLLFSEHGAAPDDDVRKWQDRLNPIWKKLAGGCHINRQIPAAIEDMGVQVFTHVEDAIQWADVLNVLRLQLERMNAGFIPSLREYNRVYGVSQARLEKAPVDTVILHPGPMNRGVEIDSAVADGPQSVILPQVTNGVAVRMAVLYLLAGGAPERAEEAKKGEA